MAARVLMPELEAVPRDQVLPAVLIGALPLVVGSIALAAVFSAEISSADAVLFMLSTSGARDIYRGYINPEATDADVLRVARIVAVCGGALGFVLAFYHQSVLAALVTFYSVLGVTLLAPILGGLFLPRGGRPGALSAMIVGVVSLFVSQYVLAMPGTVAWLAANPALAWVSASFIGLTCSTLTYLAVASARR